MEKDIGKVGFDKNYDKNELIQLVKKKINDIFQIATAKVTNNDDFQILVNKCVSLMEDISKLVDIPFNEFCLI